MARNQINDLRNHLFTQLERLNDDEDMKNPIKLEKELQRADAIAKVAQVVVNSAKVEVDFLHKVGGKSTHFISGGEVINDDMKKLKSA